MNPFLVIFLLFTSTLQLNLTTLQQTCYNFRDNNRGEVFEYRKHSEISGQHVFFWGNNIFGDKQPIFIMDTSTPKQIPIIGFLHILTEILQE